jgi:hypothetical protein
MICPVCGGPLIRMGKLANLTYVRCRNCGLEATGPDPEGEGDEGDEGDDE